MTGRAYPNCESDLVMSLRSPGGDVRNHDLLAAGGRSHLTNRPAATIGGFLSIVPLGSEVSHLT